MTAPELKPCPFCGGEAVALTGPVKTLWGVTCLRCACWMDDRADTADEAIAAWNRRADLAQPAQVRVKPLVWRDDGTNGHETDHAFGFYEVYPSPEGNMLSRDGVDSGVFPTIEPAKAAAQADYEARIFAAIEPQPDPRDEVIKGLVDALNRIRLRAVSTRGDQAYREFPRFAEKATRAALAAAKAVQK